MNVSCGQIDERLEELALGEVAEPERSLLLAHVAQCGDCRRRLDDLLALTDSLLALAPAIEPPAGFETRVLERLGVAPALAAERTTRWAGWRAVGVAAAVLVLVAAVAFGGFAVGRGGDEPSAVGSVAGQGRIVRSDGSEAGVIRLVDAERPFALVTIDRPRAANGSVTCRLLLESGGSVVIGSWSYADVKAGVWAVGIDPALLAAVGMELVDDEGAVVATATLD